MNTQPTQFNAQQPIASRARRYKSPRPGITRNRGFTLVELMIAMTMGLVLVAGLGYVFLSSNQSYRGLDATSRVQENARFAFETITNDVRMAGFTGCGFATMANTLNSANDWDKNLFGQPMVGYEGGVSNFPSGAVADNVLPNTDGIAILRANNDNEYIVDSHNPNSAQFQLKANHDIKQGEILVVTDCNHAAVFQMTNVNNNNTINTVVHNTGNATQPGNCTKGLGSPIQCTTNGTSYPFTPGSRVLKLSGALYYIRKNAANEPSLYRQFLTQAGGNATTTAEELVEGVENMQIEYGEDTDTPQDNAINMYRTANNVVDWSRVLSVRIVLTLVSRQGESVSTQSNDGLIRKNFTMTIAIRNRL